MSMDPNSFDKEIKDAQANPQAQNQGTEADKTDKNKSPDGAPVDYAKKFAESSAEAIRLLHEKEEKEAEIARLQKELEAKANQPVPPAKSTENLYPGFEQLDPEAQANLVAYTDMIRKKTLEGVYQDPAIKFAKDQYNAQKWDTAFNVVAEKYPELKTTKEEFVSKYRKVENVPDNISSILDDLAKIHLFDKAKDLGAKEEKKKLEERVELERPTGGEKTPQTHRTLEDWKRMSQENPAKFASLAKEFNADIASGKLKE